MSKSSLLLKRSVYFLAIGLMLKAVLLEDKKENYGNRRNNLKKDGLSVLGGIIQAYKAPLKWKEREIFITVLITAGIGILYLYDETISDWFQLKGEQAPSPLKDFGWYYGSPENHYAINGGFYLFGLVFKNEEVRKTGILLISASSAAVILQTITKLIIGRARPLRNEGKSSFKPFSKENSYYSFPSGHSILSFTTAYAIGTQFKNPVLKSLMYAFGSIAPVSRLWAGAHWITDAVTSICISVPLVNTIDNYLKEKRNYKGGLDESNGD